ncbi:MoaD/ThiS family protein [Candidatus Woesearchaeota archaeon]|nr:MoaD/ThiS family protein [Candidatus Woesearchaeota archaeon]
MVKVKYGEPYKTSFGTTGDKIKAGTLGELITKVESKYQGKPYVETIQKYSIVLLNNKDFLSLNQLEHKLKPKDEVLIMQMLSGG